MATKSDVFEELRIAPGDFERVRHLRAPEGSRFFRGLVAYCGATDPSPPEYQDGPFPHHCVVCSELAAADPHCFWPNV